jgi:hypothetical protein
MRDSHNLTVDWVGLFNEREYTDSYVLELRAALDASGHTKTQIVGSDRGWEPISTDYLTKPGMLLTLAYIADTHMRLTLPHSPVRFTLTRITQYTRHTDIPHNHVLFTLVRLTLAHQHVTRWLSAAIREAIGAISQHYPHCDARPGGKAPNCGADNHNALAARAEWGVPLWSSEDYSCWTDTLGAGVWASEVNSNFIGGNITMTSAWYARAPHLSLSSLPDTLHDDMSCANQPHATRVLTDTCPRACDKAPVCQCETKHTSTTSPGLYL